MILWILAGGFAGWAGFKFIGANKYRGMVVSVLIGACGGYFGGNVLSPLMGESAALPDAVDPIALVMALGSAAVCLTIGDLIARRFNV